MRNLKRILSLALAVVMVIGMMVMTTGAADIVDIDEVENIEAVSVMNALGVLEGDENGVYNPEGILTRAQAAKIIAFVKMGPASAKKLATSGVSFSDVAADHWAAPYIGYCASLNIIAGNGDGTFDPEGELTGLAFGKMLLVALGFDAARYTNNDNWATNIATDMIDADLNIDGVILTNPLSRDNAAQMAFNALFYSEETTTVTLYTITVTADGGDGSMDVVGGTSYSSFSEAYLIAKEADDGDDTWTIVPNTTTLFTDSLADEIFQLSSYGTSDNFMRPATAYLSTLNAYRAANNIMLVDDADYVIEGAISSAALYGKVGYTVANYTWTNYVDGSLDTTTNDTVKPSAITPTAFADTADGTVMYVYVDHATQSVRTCLINTYIGEVKKVTAATDAADRFVTLTDGKLFTTEEFAAKDVVLYTYSSKQVGTPAADAGIQSMELAQVVSGKLEKVTSDGVYTVAGTEYVVAAQGATSIGTANLGKTVSFYVDGYNNMMKDKGGAPGAGAQYIFVLANSVDKSTDNYQTGVTTSLEVYGVDTNGNIVTATVSEIGGSPVSTTVANALKNKVYSYTVDTNGYYKLTDKTAEATVTADVAVNATTVAHNSTTAITNSDTKYVFVEQAKKGDGDYTVTDVTVKTGNANVGVAINVDDNVNDGVADANVTPAFVVASNGVAKCVIVTRAYAEAASATAEVAYIDHDDNYTTETVSTATGSVTSHIYADAWNAEGKLTITNKTAVANGTGLYKLNDDGSVGALVTTTSGVITAINGNVITIDGSTHLNVVANTVEIYTGRNDVELKVGQTISYKVNGQVATNLDYVVVTGEQATYALTLVSTAIDATHNAVTAAYEVIGGTGVENTVSVTLTKDDGTAFAAGVYTLTATGGTVDSTVTVTGTTTMSVTFKISVDAPSSDVTLTLTNVTSA